MLVHRVPNTMPLIVYASTIRMNQFSVMNPIQMTYCHWALEISHFPQLFSALRALIASFPHLKITLMIFQM